MSTQGGEWAVPQRSFVYPLDTLLVHSVTDLGPLDDIFVLVLAHRATEGKGL